MPESTITNERDQREGLYELIRNRLGSIEDFWVAFQRTNDFAVAEQLGLEFAEDFRLLEVIGWTLVLAGPRALELGHLRWRDNDLANGRIMLGRSKTQAGLREIAMLPILRDILAAHKAQAGTIDPDELVFPTSTGQRRTSDTLRGLLQTVFDRADKLLAARGHVPLPNGLSAHKLRHTFASILVATGEDPISVMGQLVHTHPGFTLRIYSHPMNGNPGERGRLKALVAGERTTSVPPRAIDRLDGPTLEATLRRCLRTRGGHVPRAEVLAALSEELSDRFDPLDLEILPSGMARWEAHVGKARQRLVRRGIIRGDSPRGVWELSERSAGKRRDPRKLRIQR
jgi:hypothetical protein